jgi:hypothetical protein
MRVNPHLALLQDIPSYMLGNMNGDTLFTPPQRQAAEVIVEKLATKFTHWKYEDRPKHRTGILSFNVRISWPVWTAS